MAPEAALRYVGLALLYAVLATVVLTALARILGRPVSRPQAALILGAACMVFLGLHPFPDPATLDCSVQRIWLKPFGFAERFGEYGSRGAPPGAWIRDRVIASTMMNFLLPAIVGVLAARVLERPRAALLLGIAMSGFIEISQLTGLYGVYPCTYRNFDVDDLITNISGVLVGFALARACGLRPPAHDPSQ